MVKIFSDSLLSTLTGTNSGIGKTTRASWAKSTWTGDQTSDQSGGGYLRASNLLARSLQNHLTNFQTALEGFEWPAQDSIMKNARLVVADDGLKESVTALLPETYNPDAMWSPGADEETGEESVQSFYKFFSKGYDGSAATTLAPGKYEFLLTQGNAAKSLSVTVTRGMTNEEVLQAVADAVNDSTLGVQASVFTQRASGSVVEGLATTGTILALTVNAREADQTVSIRDKSGHGTLVDTLNLTAVNRAVGAADTAVYNLDDIYAESPGVYTTDSFDPDEGTTLTQGEYGFTVSMGGVSRDVSVGVSEGDTWEDVLKSLALAVNSSGLATAKITKVKRSSQVLTDQSKYILTDGIALELTANSHKTGQRLSITGGDNLTSGTFSVDSLEDGTIAVSVDQYQKVTNGTAVTLSSSGDLPDPLAASATYYLHKEDAETTRIQHGYVSSYPLRLAATREDAVAGTNLIELTDTGSGTLTMDGGNALSTLHLASPSPSTDGSVKVNGTTLTSVPDTFSLNDGRLVMSLESDAAERIPLKVVEAVEELNRVLSDIVASYNTLRTFLLANENQLDQSVAQSLKEPLDENAVGMKWLGLDQWGGKNLLTLAADDFYSALGENPQQASALLAEASTGLIPTWKDIVGTILGNDVEGYLRQGVTVVEEFLGNEMRTEVDLDKKSKLVDLLG